LKKKDKKPELFEAHIEEKPLNSKCFYRTVANQCMTKGAAKAVCAIGRKKDPTVIATMWCCNLKEL
jgi:hypothetical protein